MQSWMQREWAYPRSPPPRHVSAAVAAALLSLLLHAGLAIRLPRYLQPMNPGLPVSVPREATLVVDIRPEPVVTGSRPPPFRPDAPVAQAEGTARPGPLPLRPDPVLMAPPPAAAALAAAERPLTEPPPAPAPPAWEPRADRMEIERQLAREEGVVKPRRIEPRVVRSAEAPDFAHPSEWPDPSRLRVASAALDPSTDPAPRTAALGYPPPGAFGAGPPGGLPPAWTDEIDAGDTPAMPGAEQMLELSIRSFRDERRPEFRYFMMLIRRRGEESLPVLPKDVLFIQDTSESMTQAFLDQCKLGLQQALGTLQPGDRFDVMGFRDEQYRCFNEWTEASPAHRAQASYFIEQMLSRGRTDVFASLQQIPALPQDPDRPVLAVLVTDGRPTAGLLDNVLIIEQVNAQNMGRTSVFGFGAGSRVNRFLLDFLGYSNRGGARVIPRRADVPDALAAFAGELSRPVLHALHYRFSGLDAEDIYPRTLTHLFLDRPLVLYGRVPADSADAAVQIVGRAADGARDIVYRIDWNRAQPGDAGIRTAWAEQKAYALISEHIQTQDADLLKRLRAHAEEYGIPVPYVGELGMKPVPR